jgi:hypothetical protein
VRTALDAAVPSAMHATAARLSLSDRLTDLPALLRSVATIRATEVSESNEFVE